MPVILHIPPADDVDEPATVVPESGQTGTSASTPPPGWDSPFIYFPTGGYGEAPYGYIPDIPVGGPNPASYPSFDPSGTGEQLPEILSGPVLVGQQDVLGTIESPYGGEPQTVPGPIYDDVVVAPDIVLPQSTTPSDASEGVSTEGGITVTITDQVVERMPGFLDDLGDLGMEYIRKEFLPSGPLTPTIIDVGTEVAKKVIPEVAQRVGGGAGAPPINPSTGRPYKNMVWDPNLRKWKRCRHRRRQLLTNSDYNDLLKIQTLANTKNMQIALAKSIR